jgi:alkylation response protein AidB-like acyl-CoA dehydrogenase/predicted heme/steroid binding protein
MKFNIHAKKFFLSSRMNPAAITTPRMVTVDELSRHNLESDCWIAIDGVVYDVSKFMRIHPGGKSIILATAGKDVTEEFFSYHRKDVLVKYADKLRVGFLQGASNSIPSYLSADFDLYTPFAESGFVRGWYSPYMNNSHKKFRAGCRRVMMKYVHPFVEQLHERGDDPSDEMFEQLGSSGLLAARGGPYTMPYVKNLGIQLPGGISPDDFDYFHEMIAIDELYRTGSGGVSDGLGTGISIGLIPILVFGSKDLKSRVVSSILLGKTRCCLAITEPQTGSDVSGITTTAKLNPEGTHYIVNGIKKWITGSGSSSPTVYTAAVRTGGAGHNGISLLVIEDPKSPNEGTITKHKIKTSYSGAAGTSLLIFENVIVPRSNLLGVENQAFKIIGMNFNHERWYICCISSAFARTCVAECYRWAMQRRAFGKRLIDQPVIRYKLAEMSAITECMDSWIESLTYQMTQMSPSEQFEKLASPISLCKFASTRYGVKLADNACQIFGGRAVTRTGMGRQIEAFKNEVKFAAILGGSEEILADLAVRQAVSACDKLVKKNAEARVMARL